MEIEIAYGTEKMKLCFPDSVEVDTFAPRKADKTATYDDFVSSLNDCDAFSFLESESLLIVVNDAHRNTPTAKILTWLSDYSPDVLDRACFLIACGTHEVPDEEQLRKIFGEHFKYVGDRINCHVATNADMLTQVGVDQFGEEVLINSLVSQHDRVFIINSVEPHYFAGFTGGRKSLIPGLADRKTIERNHNLANSLEAAPMKIDGNPMAAHLQEMIELIDQTNCLTTQVVLDAASDMAGVFTGSIDQAFEQAVTLARRIYGHQINHQYDALVCEVLPPLDRNLYQVQKGLENNRAAVVDDGVVVIVSSCHEGIGSEAFYNLADNWDAATNRSVDGKVYFGSHKLSRVLGMQKQIDVRLHSTLPDDVVRHVFYEPLHDVQGFFDKQVENKRDYTVGIVYDAGGTVLMN